MVEFVFVYGTLKRGYVNHRVMEQANGVFLGDAKTSPSVFDLCDLGAFPAVVPGEHRIAGELYAVPDDGMTPLDRLEGFPRFYDRKLVSVDVMHPGDDDVAQAVAWVYFLHEPTGKVLESFDGDAKVWEK